MKIFIDFIRSKSGALLLLFLVLSAGISAAVATYFYNVSLKTFVAQKADEKATALELVSAFVTTYSSVRSQLGQNAPVPATFRAHSIERSSEMRTRTRALTGVSLFLLVLAVAGSAYAWSSAQKIDTARLTVSSGAFAQIVITCPPCFWVSRLFFPPESIVL